MSLLPVLLLALGAAPNQTIDSDPELPPGAAAVIGDEVVTMDEYLAYLLEVSGRRPLRDLVKRKLMEREAARLGIEIDPAELEAEVDAFWKTLVARHRGDEEAARADLLREGHDPDDYLNAFRSSRRSDLLATAICRATRTFGEDEVQARFEQVYGLDGIRTRVRHIYFNAARLQRDLERAGEPVARMKPDELEQLLLERAELAARRVRAGEDFESVARAESHDLSVHQNGGEIPGYNYRRYGPEFADAVRAAEVDEVFGPVRTKTGLHVAQVLERSTTALEDVRDEILAGLADAPPTANELHQLELRLRAEVRIITF